jgi:hypothetical protein
VALGPHALDPLERLVHDAAVARAHRIERDDLAFLGHAVRELLRHLRELILVARAIALGVHGDVLARLARLVGDAGGQILDRLEHASALADDTARVGALDLEADLVSRALAVVGGEGALRVHLHLLEEHLHEAERARRLRIDRAVPTVVALAFRLFARHVPYPFQVVRSA